MRDGLELGTLNPLGNLETVLKEKKINSPELPAPRIRTQNKWTQPLFDRANKFNCC